MRSVPVLLASLSATAAFAICPAADFFTSATGAGVAAGDTSGGTSSYATSCGGGGASADQQVEFTATADGDYTFSLAGSAYDTVLSAISTGDCTTELACNDDALGTRQSELTLSMTSGETILLNIDGFGSVGTEVGAWTLGVTWTAPPPPPVCAADYDLGSATGPSVATGDTTGAGNDVDGASCGSGQESEDEIYLWTAPSTDTFTAYTTGSSYDTALTVRDLGCAELYCDDDGGAGTTSAVTFSANAGDQFYLVVDGYSFFSAVASVLGIEGGSTCADTDGDGVCDWADACFGDDATFDSDFDGLCNNLDFTIEAAPSEPTPGAAWTITASNAPAGAQVFFLLSTRGAGAGPCHPSGLACLNIRGPVVNLGNRTASAAGEASVTVTVPSTAPSGVFVDFQAVWFLGGEADTSEVDFGIVQ